MHWLWHFERKSCITTRSFGYQDLKIGGIGSFWMLMILDSMSMKCLRAFLSLMPLDPNHSPRSGSHWLSDMDWLTYHHTSERCCNFFKAEAARRRGPQLIRCESLYSYFSLVAVVWDPRECLSVVRANMMLTEAISVAILERFLVRILRSLVAFF